MSVSVRIPPTLRSEVGGARQIEVKGDSVRAVLDDLVERFPALAASTSTIRQTLAELGAAIQARGGELVHFGNDPSVMPGPDRTYQSYGRAWANLSNSPFQLYKHWIHEGGISTPLIMHWPDGPGERNVVRHTPGYLPDIMATILDVTGTAYPDQWNGQPIAPLEGTSLLPVLNRELASRPPMFWEHEGNAAVRIGKWKLVRKYPDPWELYDMELDRTELNDLSARTPERVQDMVAQYQAWADRCGVIPKERIDQLLREQQVPTAFWERDDFKAPYLP